MLGLANTYVSRVVSEDPTKVITFWFPADNPLYHPLKLSLAISI